MPVDGAGHILCCARSILTNVDYEGTFTVDECLNNALLAENEIGSTCDCCGEQGHMRSFEMLSHVEEPRLLMLQFPVIEHRALPPEARTEGIEGLAWEKKSTVVLRETLNLSRLVVGGQNSTGHLVGYIHYDPNRRHYTSVVRISNSLWVKSDDTSPKTPQVVSGPVGGKDFPQPYLALYEVHPPGSSPDFALTKTSCSSKAVRTAAPPPSTVKVTPEENQVFGPVMTPELVAWAGKLCSKARVVEEKRPASSNTFNNCKNIVSGPLLQKLRGGSKTGEFCGPVGEGFSHQTQWIVSCDNAKKLAFISDVREFLGEEVINAFASALNERELKKMEGNPSYKPSFMLDSFCTSKVMKLGDCRNHTFSDVDKHLSKVTMPKAGEGSCVRGAVDLFLCNKVIFPINDSLHWTFLQVDMATMKQSYACSLHLSPEENWSKEVHSFLLHYHLVRHGCDLMIEDSRGNKELCPSKIREDMKPVVNIDVTVQSPKGNDCLLHTCANAALSADGRDFRVTGGLNKDLLGREMRARMAVMIKTGQFMFDAPGCPDVDLESLKKEEAVVDLVSGDDNTEAGSGPRDSSLGGQGSIPTDVKVKTEPADTKHNGPDREAKMEKLEEMRAKYARKRKGGKVKQKEAPIKKGRRNTIEGWNFIRATGKKVSGKDPVCAGCKRTVSRAHDTRIFRFVQYQTKKTRDHYSRTLVLHCRASCVANLKQPKELSHLKGVCTKEELLNYEWEEGYLEKNLDLKSVLEACK